jgi:hypothetical protein
MTAVWRGKKPSYRLREILKTRGSRPLWLSAVQSGMTLIAKNGTGLEKGGFKGLTYEELRIVGFI